MKRNNWTNEEVIHLLEGFKMREEDLKRFNETFSSNDVLDDVIEEFRAFECDAEEYHALAYNPKDKMVYHVGKLLPR